MIRQLFIKIDQNDFIKTITISFLISEISYSNINFLIFFSLYIFISHIFFYFYIANIHMYDLLKNL